MIELTEMLELRVLLYRFLGGLYNYPITFEKVEPIIKLEIHDNIWLDSLISFQNYLKGISDWESFLEDANIEYTRLFEGPGKHPAPPFASFYLDGGTVMGASAIAVRKEYIKWDLAPIRIGKIPDDHIAMEFTFLSYLAGEAYLILSKNDNTLLRDLLKAQTEFLNKHLIIWVPQFCLNIISDSTMKFFNYLAVLTKIYLKIDYEWMEDYLNKTNNGGNKNV